MDIILDTNAFALDFHMRSARFSSLLDYLKRTGSKLVILDAVKLELLALYRRELESRLRDAESACSKLSRITRYSVDEPDTDIETELKFLEDRLNESPNGVEIYKCSPSIDLGEVVRRGAYRVRPASEKGEQLRDVIIWLSVLEYAKQFNPEVGFISRDNAFWAELNPHQQIADDILHASEHLKIYKDVEQFISNNNLRSTRIDLTWLSQFVNIDDQGERVLQYAARQLASTFSAFKLTIHLEDFKFASGTSYEVSANNYFAEFDCDVTFSLSGTPIYPVEMHGALSYSPVVFDTTYNQVPAGPYFENMESSKGAGFLTPGTIYSLGTGKFVGPSLLSAVGSSGLLNPITYAGTYPVTIPKTAKGKANFSMRTAGGSLQKLDLDSVSF